MRRLVKSVLLAAAILVTGCLAAACVQSASGAVITSPPSASAPATATAPPPTPLPPSPAPSAANPPAAPSTAPPVTPASSSPAPSSGSGFNLIWLWAVLGGLVLVGIIVLATRSPGSSAAAVNWRVRAADAYKEGGHFDSAVREGERQGAFLDPDGAAWHHIQNRADNLTEALYILRETARLLAPDGRLLATFFLLNDVSVASLRGRDQFNFPFVRGAMRLLDPDNPGVGVAIEQHAVLRMAADAGLIVEQIEYGSWSGRPGAATFQDAVVCRRA